VRQTAVGAFPFATRERSRCRPDAAHRRWPHGSGLGAGRGQSHCGSLRRGHRQFTPPDQYSPRSTSSARAAMCSLPDSRSRALAPRIYLIRAAGPSLGASGVPGTLADPKLELYDSNQVKIGENDTYAATLSSVFSSVGAFAFVPGAKDAALMVTLPPGGYTVQIFRRRWRHRRGDRGGLRTSLRGGSMPRI